MFDMQQRGLKDQRTVVQRSFNNSTENDFKLWYDALSYNKVNLTQFLNYDLFSHGKLLH